MNITESRDGQATVLSIDGRLDATGAPELKSRFRELVQSGRVRFVADLSGVSFLDSSGLGVLVSALRLVGPLGGDVKISGLKPEMQSLFALTRLNKVFEIHETAQVALESLR